MSALTCALTYWLLVFTPAEPPGLHTDVVFCYQRQRECEAARTAAEWAGAKVSIPCKRPVRLLTGREHSEVPR